LKAGVGAPGASRGGALRAAVACKHTESKHASTHPRAGSSKVYLTGPVGAPGSPEAGLANPVRMQETNLGNMFCDALIWYIKVCARVWQPAWCCASAHAGLPSASAKGAPVPPYHSSGCSPSIPCPPPPRPPGGTQNQTTILDDISNTGLPVAALYNGGGIRASAAAGNLTQGNLMAMSPFDNWAVVKRVPAVSLLKSLQNSVSQWTTVKPAGRFLQARRRAGAGGGDAACKRQTCTRARTHAHTHAHTRTRTRTHTHTPFNTPCTADARTQLCARALTRAYMRASTPHTHVQTQTHELTGGRPDIHLRQQARWVWRKVPQGLPGRRPRAGRACCSGRLEWRRADRYQPVHGPPARRRRVRPRCTPTMTCVRGGVVQGRVCTCV
jgi:hypothetical protein